MSLFSSLSEKLTETLAPRFQGYEVRSSLRQIAARWKVVLTEDEKSKVSRILGGNRYAKTTRALLDELFNAILAEEE